MLMVKTADVVVSVAPTTVAVVIGVYTLTGEFAEYSRLDEALLAKLTAKLENRLPAVTLDTDWMMAQVLESGTKTFETSCPGNSEPVVLWTTKLAVLGEAEMVALENTLMLAWGTADRTGLVVGPNVTVWDKLADQVMRSSTSWNCSATSGRARK